MNHEFDGEKYKKASAHQKEWGQKLIQELDLKGNERVLDLGCGDGGLTMQLAECVPRGEVIGVDASRGMIRVARERSQDNLKFIVMDINELKFQDEFDVVFSNATLHWVKDHELLLKNAENALRSGGRIRFNFAGDGNCSNFIKIVKEAMSLPLFSKNFNKFEWPWFMPTIAEYEHIIDKIGFKEYQVWEENADRYFPDSDALVQWIDQPSVVPFIAGMDISLKNRFRDLIVRRMMEETMDGTGKCFETFRRINVQAVVS